MESTSKGIKRSHIELYDRICERAESAPLSELLPAVLRLAKGMKEEDLARWVRLELDGYVRGNPSIAADVTVPEYRSVSGQYYDDHGNRLVLEDAALRFVFEDRLRFGVSELESLARREEEIRVQRTAGIDLVREHLGVEVTTYGFPVTSVLGILASIRAQLVDRLSDLEDRVTEARDALPVERPALSPRAHRSWIQEHAWKVVFTVLGGLLVAYLSYLFGWG